MTASFRATVPPVPERAARRDAAAEREPDDDRDAEVDGAEPTPPIPAAVRAAQDAVADVFGNIAEFWGFTRTQGRIFGLVFLSPEPVDQATVRARLDISAGSASMTLASLVEWGVLHRDGRSYVAETNFWKLITTVMRSRERREVEDAIARVRAAHDLLADVPDDDGSIAFLRARLAHLLEFFQTGHALLQALLERGPIHGILNALARRASRLQAGRERREKSRKRDLHDAIRP
jgi:DNA-binding transcriptional regulator GbsR (MarR family)